MMAIILGKPKKLRKSQIFRKRPPVQIYPTLIEKKFQKFRSAVAYELRDLVRSELIPQLPKIEAEFSKDFGRIRQDDFFGMLDRILNSIMDKFETFAKSKEQEIRRTAVDVDHWNSVQHRKTIHHLIGVEIIETSRSMSNAVDLWTKENVDLIVNIGAQERAVIQQMVSDSFRNGRRWETLAMMLEDHWRGRDERKTDWVPGMSVPQRAELVARDQIGKLNGQVSQLRQSAIGVERYMWRTSMDERVRGNPVGRYPNAKRNHWKLEGKIFYWNPEDGPVAPFGPPGSDYQCRCYAEPILEDILGFDPDA